MTHWAWRICWGRVRGRWRRMSTGGIIGLYMGGRGIWGCWRRTRSPGGIWSTDQPCTRWGCSSKESFSPPHMARSSHRSPAPSSYIYLSRRGWSTRRGRRPKRSICSRKLSRFCWLSSHSNNSCRKTPRGCRTRSHWPPTLYRWRLGISPNCHWNSAWNSFRIVSGSLWKTTASPRLGKYYLY